MRTLEKYPQREVLNPTAEQLGKCGQWVQQEVEDAYAAKSAQERLWQDLLRQYEAVPKKAVVNTPIENAPNVEVPLGAIACDSIYAQIIDLIYTVSPIITCRAVNGPQFIRHAKALQTWVNYMAQNELDLRLAAEQAIMDDCQLGTGVYYIPFQEHVQKAHSFKVKSRRPVVLAHPVEDVITPGGVMLDVQKIPWIGLRFWHTQSELNGRAKYRKWDISKCTPTASKDWVRHRRETLARTKDETTRRVDIFEIHYIYASYDIDDDGFDEDLLITWDRTSNSLLEVRYNPYDKRPIEKMCYQIRPHLFWGIGIMEMLQTLQEEETILHNQQLLNVILANARIWKARTGTVPENLKLWPNRVVSLADPDDLKPEAMADIYNSLPATQAMIDSLAQRRVGANELTQPSQSQTFGNRTPGITALSLIQQMNKRFTPAFDGVRLATSAAVRQAVWRYSELLKDGDIEIEDHIIKRLGPEEGRLVIELLMDPEFDQHVSVELTASSASINRDADRQNAIMLANFLEPYYEKMIQLVAMISNPQVPEQVRTVALKSSQALGELLDRTLRTFDQTRDPATFIVDIAPEIQQAQEQADQIQQAQAMMTFLPMLMEGANPAQQPTGNVEPGQA